MKVVKTSIPDVVLIEPDVFTDARGCFFESFNSARFQEAIGRHVVFVQDNQSSSMKHVLRGMHYQVHKPQGKLVRVVSGEILDVVLDIRRSSPTFLSYVATRLSGDNHHQLWAPEGFAHGFLVLSERAEVIYKTTRFWSPTDERCIAWNDPLFSSVWPVEVDPILSPKDMSGKFLCDSDLFD